MSFEEMVVALAGAVGGIMLVGFIFAKVVGLIKSWINRNNTAITEDDFDRLAQAFMKYRQDSKRRIQNLEAIITDELGRSPDLLSSRGGQQGVSNETIEIEEDEQRKTTNDDDGSLRNMLHGQ
ncbi:MAG TPA: hypothetical protein VK074_04165 [Fodinibius sp.]|nr:hypothetical protein [Fodinibius sp.]